MHDRDDLRQPRRAHPAADPGPAARPAPAGGRAGRGPGSEPARRVQAPAGAARRAAGRRAPRRAAPDLPRARPAAGGGRRVARALPAAVRRPSRRPGTTPRRQQGAEVMTAADDGTLETLDDGRARLRFVRRLSHPVDRVWAALTEPGEMRKWWAAADELELREGGRFTIRWLNTDEQGNTAIARGTVSAVDPPRVLELDSDIHGVMRWELEPRGDATALTFTSTLHLPDEYRDKVLAGWHAHLDFLEDALDGRPIEDWDNWPVEVWQKHNDRYAEKVA